MKVQSWIEKDLWSENYFEPSRLSEECEIFRSGVSFPLITSVVDGRRCEPTWAKEPPESPTGAFFTSIKQLVVQFGASWFYVTDPDNAFSNFEWEKEIDPEYFNQYQLEEFEKNPAIQGGVSYMCIALHDHSGLIVFELDSEHFRICFYGNDERKLDLQRILARKAAP